MGYTVRYQEDGVVSEHGERFEASIVADDGRLVALVPVQGDAERIAAALTAYGDHTPILGMGAARWRMGI